MNGDVTSYSEKKKIGYLNAILNDITLFYDILKCIISIIIKPFTDNSCCTLTGFKIKEF